MTPLPQGMNVTGEIRLSVLTPEALTLLAEMERAFGGRRRELLGARRARAEAFAAGERPDFLGETEALRADDWRIRPLPAAIRDRRVEITGPPDRKMIINALNSGAQVFMADFEDALSPTWQNLMDGQENLIRVWSNTIDFTDPKTNKAYALGGQPATLMVRPRGWHLEEAHVQVDGKPMSASLFDFTLACLHHRAHHDAEKMLAFYLPKLESHLEARLWNDVFAFMEKRHQLATGTLRATVLIETLPAAFEMDEILYELRDHMLGLNCGRWDYIFSYIKCLGRDPRALLPDRSQVVMGEAFLHAYSRLLIKTCHRRGAFAMGGMAAQIPVKNDEEANRLAYAKVRADKEREVRDGHDGTWVAHPALVPVAHEVFKMPNQLDVGREDIVVSREDLLRPHEGTCTEAGARECVRVGVRYIAAWLAGRGAVPLYNLMEDAATAEICRSQLWQWQVQGVRLDTGRKLDAQEVRVLCDDEREEIVEEAGETGERALALFSAMATDETCAPFLTLDAYTQLVEKGEK